MQIQSVSALSIAGILFTLLISFALPITLLIVLRVKLKTKIYPFFIGCATFFLFALVLEQLLHLLVLKNTSIMENVFLYALYGGLAAAAFEETGRFLAMKFCMKKCLTRENALVYGAGHGGIEAMLIVGIVYINNLVAAVMINTGLLEQSLSVLEPALRDTAIESLAPLWSLSGGTFFLAGIERVLAVFLHIALSVFIYKAVSGKKHYFLAAFGIHFLVDFAAVIASNYLSTVLVEVIVFVLTAAAVYAAGRLYKSEENEK